MEVHFLPAPGASAGGSAARPTHRPAGADFFVRRNNAAGFHAATIVGLSRNAVGVGQSTGLTVGGTG
jgi:hypothetical protein